MFKWLIALLGFLLVVQPAYADEQGNLFGIWKLTSSYAEVQDTGERIPIYGKNPTGFVIVTPEGRMMTIIEAEGRKAPKTDEEHAALFSTFAAYTGMFRRDGDRVITKVDASWNPAWYGTEQVRFYKLEGDRLMLSTAWAPSPNLPGRMVRGVLTWERVK
jgi:hypothetical protein